MKMFTSILIILLAAGLTISRAQDKWTQKADFGGTGRSSATAFSIGDKGYLGTGTTPTVSILFKDFWEYDPAADTWTQKADFGGGERAGAVGFSINDKGYIGTGFSGSFWGTYYNDFWEYDPVTNIWTKKSDFGGVPRIEAAGFSIGDKGYIGTGFTYTIFDYYSDFWEYDPASDVWTKKADFGGGEWADPAAFSIGDKGYMGTGWKNGLSAEFYEYDPATNSWTQKADYGGGAIQYSVGFSIANKGYIGTGVDNDVFYEYDPDLDKWTKKADYGGGNVNVATGFSIGNKGYIGTGQTNIGLKSFWEYIPESALSCTIPPVETTVNITSTSAKLKWDDVVDAKGYKVRYKEAGSSEWTKITGVKSNSKNISGLTPNTLYYWEVKSVCSANPIVASDWSEKQSFTTGTSATCSGLPSDLSQNLVAYYPFCGNANDMSGNNNNPSVVNATLATDRFGNPNSAYSFNGANQYIKGSCSNYPSNARTISIWFKVSDFTKHYGLMGYGGGVCGTSILVFLNLNGLPDSYSTTAHCFIDNCFTSTGYPPNTTWNNWIITSGNNVTKFYLNGTLILTVNGVDYNGTGVTGKDFIFGNIPNNNGLGPYTASDHDNLDGSLDDIVIYNTVLDNNQVQSLYQFFSTGGKASMGDEQAVVSELYPNPVAESFTLDLHLGTSTDQSANIFLLNSLGQIIYSTHEVIANGELKKEITMPSTASSGWYVMRVLMNDQVIEKKLMYQK